MNTSSFLFGLRQWRIALIVYFIQLCLALTLGMQAHSVLESSIGNSLEINKLLAQYDHTVLTDFLKVHGASITPLIGQLRWLLLVWLIFSVFINAGLLYSTNSEKYTGRAGVAAFWQGAVEYFFPFLKISLIFLGIALLWTMLTLAPIAMFFQPALRYFITEQYAVWAVMFLIVIYLAGLVILMVWSLISRVLFVNNLSMISSSLKNGWRTFHKNGRAFLRLMMAFLGVQVLLLAIYWVLEAFIGMTTPVGILLLFLIQQAFVFLRIQVRQMLFAGVGKLTNNF
ncbi:MAG: hypothetical protein ACKVT2_10065 [Saprospiraceae bacterium]